MVVAASITGLFRTLLIIAGVILLLRFIGQLLTAKRNMEEERKLNEEKRRFDEEKRKSSKNLGKTKILSKSQGSDVEDVDFEELN